MAFTGGTGDVLPQIMTLSSGVAGAADDYVVSQVALPVPRLGSGSSDRATVFELLWVDWYLNPENIADVSATEAAYLSTSSLRKSGDTSTAATLAVDFADPRSFACAVTSRLFTTSGYSHFEMPQRINLTDMNGNGILVATDKIFVTGANVGALTVGQYIAKVGYRLVNVGTMEYVGIVQSQIS